MNKAFLVYIGTEDKPWNFETDEAIYGKVYHAIRQAVPDAHLDMRIAPEEFQPTIVEGNVEA